MARRVWCGALSLLAGFGCSDAAPLTVVESPRPCEALAETCPASAPVVLQLGDLDGRDGDDIITIGLAGALSVTFSGNHDRLDIQVDSPVEGQSLSTCAGVDQTELLYNSGTNRWWRYRAVGDQLEPVEYGGQSAATLTACLDLGLGSDVVAQLDQAVLTLPSGDFPLKPNPAAGGVNIVSFAALTAAAGELTVFAAVEHEPDLYVATLDLAAVQVLSDADWAMGLVQLDSVTLAGADLVVTGIAGDDSEGYEAELLILRDVDANAPLIPAIERFPLPWQASKIQIAELDGDEAPEILVAPMSVSEFVVLGMGEVGEMIVAVGFDAVDLAAGDRDADGIDEVYVLDLRDERIIQVEVD